MVVRQIEFSVVCRSNAPKYPAALGVAAARFTSLFWSVDSVYTWGLHGGQLGHIRGQERTVRNTETIGDRE